MTAAHAIARREEAKQIAAFAPVKIGEPVYLRADEAERLRASLGALAQLADHMGVMHRPILEWSQPEMMRFLAGAVRAAMPIETITHFSPDFDDRIPF